MSLKLLDINLKLNLRLRTSKTNTMAEPKFTYFRFKDKPTTRQIRKALNKIKRSNK